MKLDLAMLLEKRIQNFEHKQKNSPHEVCLDDQYIYPSLYNLTTYVFQIIKYNIDSDYCLCKYHNVATITILYIRGAVAEEATES